MLTIYPYKNQDLAVIQSNDVTITQDGVWVFDDKDKGLKNEALISGTDLILDYLSKDIPNAKKGFKLEFSHEPFEGYQLEADFIRTGNDDIGAGILGSWYHCAKINQDFWLCPSLFLYFPFAPQQLFARASPKQGFWSIFKR